MRFLLSATLLLLVFWAVQAAETAPAKTDKPVTKGSVSPGLKKSDSGKSETPVLKTVVLKPQTTCPVMGDKINRKFFVDYKGKRIYVCCGMCTDKVRKDPEKYIKKLEGMGQSVETLAQDIPATVPNMKKTPVEVPQGHEGHEGHEHH